MPKGLPTEKPIIGQTVKLRGREPNGTLVAVNDRGWCQVIWADTTTAKGPGIVHIDELERLLN